MRSRGWVVITVIVILAVVFAGIGAALIVGGGASDEPGAPVVTAPSAVTPGIFQLRQVLFQESGEVQRRPPLPPGPAEGGKNATRDLLRTDCSLPARPMADGDNVILCDAPGFSLRARAERAATELGRPGSGTPGGMTVAGWCRCGWTPTRPEVQRGDQTGV